MPFTFRDFLIAAVLVSIVYSPVIIFALLD